MGSIGTAVAKRARAFDMRVLYHNRNRVSEAEEKLLGRCCNNFEVETERDLRPLSSTSFNSGS